MYKIENNSQISMLQCVALTMEKGGITAQVQYLGELGILGNVVITNQVNKPPTLVSEESLGLMRQLITSLEADVARGIFNYHIPKTAESDKGI